MASATVTLLNSKYASHAALHSVAEREITSVKPQKRTSYSMANE